MDLVFRTSANTTSTPIRGMRLAAIRMGLKEYESAIFPMMKVETMVRTPAAVPLIPLTDATESLLNRSEGRTRAIVENEA